MTSRCSWTAPNDVPIDCVCLGTGRFLRAVLVPALIQSGHKSALLQPRGRTFLDSILATNTDDVADDGAKTYPVDTVLATGKVETTNVPIYGAFSLGQTDDRKAVFEWLSTCRFANDDDDSSGGYDGLPRVVGVGVTEAGLSRPDTPAMKDLYEILRCLHRRQTPSSQSPTASTPTTRRMSIINTDNVPYNGDVIKSHMLHIARERNDESMATFLNDRAYFHNSMVDRITSHRPGDPLVPRAEPVPAKALVVLDPLELLKTSSLGNVPGVVLRQTVGELQNDVELKLRVANGTHTALAHLLALLGITMTNHVVANPPRDDNNTENDSDANTEASLSLIVQYLDSLVEAAIVPAWVMSGAAASSTTTTTEGSEDRERAVRDAWDDWRIRLWHPAFGLSSYFITQNGPAKGGIRLGPTVRDLMMSASTSEPNPSKVPVTVAFALAALLRWLTPHESCNSAGVYRGRLQPSWGHVPRRPNEDNSEVEYADGLRYNLHEGWYEFRCSCMVSRNEIGDRVVLSDWLSSQRQHPEQPMDYRGVIRSYLLSSEGGNLADVAAKQPAEMETLVKATARLYARMMAGDDLLELLHEMVAKEGVYKAGLETSCSALVADVSLGVGHPLHP